MTRNFYYGKDVLVTGHTGFKGSWLSIWLSKLGANVTGYALEPPTEPSMFKICKINEHINSIAGDVRNIDKFSNVIKNEKPEIVFHLASQPLVRQSYKNPVETYETNIMGTVNLLNTIRECSHIKSVVVVTSDKCYKNTESLSGYKEGDRLGGYDPYSSSKACVEIVTNAFRDSFYSPDKYDKHGVAIATARAGNVIGGGDFALDRLVPDCIKAFIDNRKILIRNPASVRPWQHVLESLCGYMVLAERLYLYGPEYGGAWNFGPYKDNEKTVEYVVNKLCSLWGNESGYELDMNNNPHETNNLRLDSGKAMNLLGFKPKWNIDKVLEMVVSWSRYYLCKDTSQYEVSLSQIGEYEKCNEERI